MVRAVRWLALWLAVLGSAAQAQRTGGTTARAHEPNAAEQLGKPYVVLVALNGFRPEYAKKYGATHLLTIAARGASAPEGMIPAYPSQTFPNLYTIVTGLYPEHHGIVADAFYDPARKETWRGNDPKIAGDGSWYSGVPLWSLAEQHGMRSACLLWPGCEATIAGERPAYSAHDDTTSDARRVEQVIAWLRLPGAERPHLIALFFDNVEHAASTYGPESPQAAAAVRHADELIGILERDLNALHLPIDLIVVSDHGLARVEGEWIDVDSYAPLTGFTTAGPLLYAPSEAAANAAYQKLKAADARFMVYRRGNLPAHLHFSANPRAGDPVIVARGPYALAATGMATQPAKGEAGFDPFLMPEMRGIFYAEGPDIRRGVTLRPFENVNVYPLIAKILGLKAPPDDGNVNVLSGILMPTAAQ
ncbi:MAG: ectonucleotide pyrophosphatase/phosphodiesterase [Acidobacteriaceae bacterium]